MCPPPTIHNPPLSLPNSPAPPARNYAPLHTTTAAHYIVIMHKCTVQMHPAKATILYALCIYVLNCGLGCKKCYINYYSTNYAFASNMQMYWTSVETKPGVKCWQLQRIQALELPNSPACKDEIMHSTVAQIVIMHLTIMHCSSGLHARTKLCICEWIVQ